MFLVKEKLENITDIDTLDCKNVHSFVKCGIELVN